MNHLTVDWADLARSLGTLGIDGQEHGRSAIAAQTNWLDSYCGGCIRWTVYPYRELVFTERLVRCMKLTVHCLELEKN